MFWYVRFINVSSEAIRSLKGHIMCEYEGACKCFMWICVRESGLSAPGEDDAPDVDIDVVSLDLYEASPTGFPQGKK